MGFEAVARRTRKPYAGRASGRQHAGFTLTELVVVMLIVAILLGIGVPSYRYVSYSNRVASEINALLGDLQFARSEATREGQTVTVCPAAATLRQCAARSTAWQNGWIVFSDVNNNATVAGAGDILRVQPAFNGTPPDTLISDNALSFISFNREGFATAFPAAAQGYVTLTLHTSPKSAQWTRCLQIFSTGMMGTEKTTDPQGNCT